MKKTILAVILITVCIYAGPVPADTIVEFETGNESAVINDNLEIIELPGPKVLPVEEIKEKTPKKKPAIAVLPFKVLGESFNMDADTGAIICDAFVDDIDSLKYEVFERQHLKQLLKEQGFQESTLVDNPQGSARFGRLSSVDYVVIGTISRLGGHYSLSARLVDSVNGKIKIRKRVGFRSISHWPEKVAELVHLMSLSKDTENNGDNGITEMQITGNDLLDAVNPVCDFAVTIKTAGNRRTYYTGEYITFQISSEKDCYITLITADSNGQMTLLLPNKWQKSIFIPANKKLTIPSKYMKFRFPIKSPYGETIVKAIATYSPLRLSGVNSRSIENSGFQKLDSSVKAIGVEAAPSKEYSEISGLDDLLKPGQWSTDELIIVTANKTSHPDNVTLPTRPNHRSELFDYDHIGVNISDRIVHRYKQLTRNTLNPSQLNLHRTGKLNRNNETDEYLVFSKNSSSYIKIFPNRLSEFKDSNKYIVIPNINMYSMSLPATTLSEVQWALKNRFAPGNDLQIADDYIKNISKPAALIGLVDGQVDWLDKRISHAAWTNPNEIPGNGIDDDGNGYADDIKGWNFVDDSNRLCLDPYRFNHGTAMVSVLASRTIQKDYDVIGIAPQVKIVTAVVLTSGNSMEYYQKPLQANLSKVIDAIKYVADCGAKVINCSFGTYVTDTELAKLSRIPLFQQLEKKGVTLVCAAGNDNVNIDNNPVFPASLPAGNIIAVAATDPAGLPATHYNKTKKQWVPFTNFGEKTVDISAPGTMILTGAQRGRTNLYSGTSYSAAFITALKATEISD